MLLVSDKMLRKSDNMLLENQFCKKAKAYKIFLPVTVTGLHGVPLVHSLRRGALTRLLTSMNGTTAEASIINTWFADAMKPTEAELCAIETCVFNWCDKIHKHWRPSSCACELCFFLSLDACGPAIIRRSGRLHYLCCTSDDNSICYECVTCYEMQRRLHEAQYPSCDCEVCEYCRECIDNDELTDNELEG